MTTGPPPVTGLLFLWGNFLGKLIIIIFIG